MLVFFCIKIQKNLGILEFYSIFTERLISCLKGISRKPVLLSGSRLSIVISTSEAKVQFSTQATAKYEFSLSPAALVSQMPATQSSTITKADTKLYFASAPCSRYSDALATAWSFPIAAYISHNNVFILSTDSYSVIDVIPIRHAPLNAVKLICHRDSILLLAVASDGYLSICAANSDGPFVFRSCASLLLHETSCLAFDVAMLLIDYEQLLFIVSVSDSSLVITQLSKPVSKPPDSKTVATYKFPARPDGPIFIPHAVSMHAYSKDILVIAMVGTDRRIHLFQASPSGILVLLTRIPAHRDWGRSVAWGTDSSNGLLLSSASSDGSIRLFRLTPFNKGDPPQPLRLQYTLNNTLCAVRSLALLDEHNGPVHSVRFSCERNRRRLLSASLDGTVTIWDVTQPKSPALIARFGLLGGHSVHATGFFATSFAQTVGRSTSTVVIAAAFSGALHRWEANADGDSFVALPAVGGHGAPVRHVVWAPDGSFLLSASDDKSVRAFVEVDGRFVEWARPQVHGHAVFSIAFCNPYASRYVSAAEERMLRVFDAPSTFHVPGVNEHSTSATVARATLPELGLSNKAVFVGVNTHDDASGEAAAGGDDAAEENGVTAKRDDDVDDMKVKSLGATRGADSAPLEEELKQDTLWPETAKLYGHGNEVVRVAAHPSSGTIASACLAQSARDAEIIVWDANIGMERGRLHAHDLTVTDMRFSPDGKLLVTASRDRSVAIFERDSCVGANRFNFHLVDRASALHSRVIYACDWVDNQTVVTAGRDKRMRILTLTNLEGKKALKEITKIKFDAAVSAVDCCAGPEDTNLVAVGLDSGDFCVLEAQLTTEPEDMNLHTVFQAGERLRCGSRITTIQWRPIINSESPNSCPGSIRHLALGSEDMSVRIFSISFELKSGGKRT